MPPLVECTDASSLHPKSKMHILADTPAAEGFKGNARHCKDTELAARGQVFIGNGYLQRQEYDSYEGYRQLKNVSGRSPLTIRWL